MFNSCSFLLLFDLLDSKNKALFYIITYNKTFGCLLGNVVIVDDAQMPPQTLLLRINISGGVFQKAGYAK